MFSRKTQKDAEARAKILNRREAYAYVSPGFYDRLTHETTTTKQEILGSLPSTGVFFTIR